MTGERGANFIVDGKGGILEPNGSIGRTSLAKLIGLIGLIDPAGIKGPTVRLGEGTRALADLWTPASLLESCLNRVVSPTGPTGLRVIVNPPSPPPTLPVNLAVPDSIVNPVRVVLGRRIP